MNKISYEEWKHQVALRISAQIKDALLERDMTVTQLFEESEVWETAIRRIISADWEGIHFDDVLDLLQVLDIKTDLVADEMGDPIRGTQKPHTRVSEFMKTPEYKIWIQKAMKPFRESAKSQMKVKDMDVSDISRISGVDQQIITDFLYNEGIPLKMDDLVALLDALDIELEMIPRDDELG